VNHTSDRQLDKLAAASAWNICYLCGIEQKPGAPALRGDDESFKFNDPDGFVVQVNGPKYTGHVGP
jgi:hypothetical protein